MVDGKTNGDLNQEKADNMEIEELCNQSFNQDVLPSGGLGH